MFPPSVQCLTGVDKQKRKFYAFKVFYKEGNGQLSSGTELIYQDRNTWQMIVHNDNPNVHVCSCGQGTFGEGMLALFQRLASGEQCDRGEGLVISLIDNLTSNTVGT